MSQDLFLECGAVISDCGQYRYLLRRTWDHDRMRALFVMLNPSTADASINDPTIRSCARLCRSWDYGSFEVINLFGWRATKPKELARAANPVGPDNDRIANAAIGRCDVVIAAWGANAMADKRADAMRGLIESNKPAVFCLGKTKHGYPKHPLYIKTGTPLEVWQ
ncbi:MAG: DUF1643 domain-containing protein [Proteobacteria bacterium]|nr:DUF1643 domain-containing protein [Pseudomonadota bacterium]